MPRFTGRKCFWGLYHAEAVSTTFDKELTTSCIRKSIMLHYTDFSIVNKDWNRKDGE